MVTTLLSKGKDQGYLLSDDIIAFFPNPEEQVESLDDLYTWLMAEGIEVLDQAPAKSAPKPLDVTTPERPEAAEPLSVGVSDSVRLYLQEIGETDLLTIQEEVWLAKRMERGKLAEARLADASLSADDRLSIEVDIIDADRARAHLIQANLR